MSLSSHTRLTGVLVAGVIATCPSFASAIDGVTIVPQIAFQQKQLDFKQSFKGGDNAGIEGDFDLTLPTLNLTVTALYQKGYLSIKYDNSFGNNFADADNGFTKANSEVERSDFSITAGYNVWKALSLFAGYMTGDTKITPDPRYIDNPGAQQNNAQCVNTFPCFPTVISNLAQDHKLLDLSPYEQKYKESGFFLGASYGLQIKQLGTLSFSVAYALMDGEYTDNYLEGTETPKTFRYEGDSKGYSLGLTWSAPLTQNTGYFLDLRRQNYNMDADDNTALFSGSVETEENMTTATVGIQGYF
ncbi:MAG: hypothetical protein CSA52_03010 [Gammaproteobacteria bacterium]|nr:MAG: hypothetical protein CSB48_03745 [Pseudomonadota bacterium]PIE38167.1 MAG: hypothetical protein CSA52_03010 [Gammaproteobacteria bacterium]